MPSSSKKQHNFMAAIANNPAFAKKAGVPQSVGSDFIKADKGRKFAKGGDMAESKAFEKKEMNFFKKKGAPKSLMKGEEADQGMKRGGRTMSKGGCTKMAKGGAVKDIGGKGDIGGKSLPAPKNANKTGGDLSGKLARPSGGEGVEKGYKAQTKIISMPKQGGGRGDGIAQRGKTKIQASKEM
jgi:hypothetical protein